MSLLDKLKWLRSWIKQVAKKFPDKYVRGFVDSLCLVEEFLDEIESIISYTDDVALDYFIRNKEKMDMKSEQLRRKLGAGHRDEKGLWHPAVLTDDETDHLLWVMLEVRRQENRKKFGGAMFEKNWTKMSNDEKKKAVGRALNSSSVGASKC